MAKFYGNLGFVETTEIEPGIWEHQTTERPYYGDVLNNSLRNNNSGSIVENMTIGHNFSVVADSYAFEKTFAIKYVTWMGVRWSVTSVSVQHPRLRISVGEVYNGPTSRLTE